MSDWSSFTNDKEIMEAWRSYLEESEDIEEGFFGDLGRKVSRWSAGDKINKAVGRFYGPFGDEEEEEAPSSSPTSPTAPGPGATPVPTATVSPLSAPPASASAAASGDVLDIPGTELSTMGMVLHPGGKGALGPKLAKKIDQIIKKRLGAAMNKPEFKPTFKAFRAALFPALAQIDKKAHIDVGESIQRQVVITEIDFANLFPLNEEYGARQKKKDRTGKVGSYGSADNVKLNKGQRRHAKGRLRGKAAGSGASLRMFQPGKDGNSILAKAVTRALQKELEAVEIDQLAQIANQVMNTIRDPKDKKWYGKNYTSFIAKNPDKRMGVYKQNVGMLMQYLRKLISAAGVTAQKNVGTVDVVDPTMQEGISKKQLGRILSEEFSRVLNEKTRTKRSNKADS